MNHDVEEAAEEAAKKNVSTSSDIPRSFLRRWEPFLFLAMFKKKPELTSETMPSISSNQRLFLRFKILASFPADLSLSMSLSIRNIRILADFFDLLASVIDFTLRFVNFLVSFL
ncbi:hypothetical protein F2Q69_00021227 [Brassica cretica]|uniref:Uncharacterized protein n=1 Tax=Brassica cretica TaxID=69181 RepID=A0A8S9QL67_BRACR|nr:hypothetical protein F2Q69_00021227 [Brassica cretica]